MKIVQIPGETHGSDMFGGWVHRQNRPSIPRHAMYEEHWGWYSTVMKDDSGTVPLGVPRAII